MKRKPHTPEEKARMVIEVLRGERILNEIASEHEIHPNMLTNFHIYEGDTCNLLLLTFLNYFYATLMRYSVKTAFHGIFIFIMEGCFYRLFSQSGVRT